MIRPRFLAILLASCYVALVVVANVMTAHLGLLPAGFGLLVTAGTFCAGLTIAVRNPLQEVAGLRWVMAAIVLGALLSWLLGTGRIAIASGLTFLVGEAIDMTVYTALRRRGWARAGLGGIAVGAIADTMLFLWLAGFPLTWHTIAGQLLVKAVYASVLGLPMVKAVLGCAVPRQRVQPEGA